ncbi:phosphonoacetaldehyde hydrolase [Lacticaseibacillus jixianensis]|uniref:Phosphonoacetaldehyde hydrolase n=1 Tax=Lacticaseibacillus jixianensis TaxID=2486012 RepID=A0ABW4B9Y4_9LACO|nr:phosphonoacetaldehyde hydrolase [Lacticaseibacillus jixianensis]
MAIEAVIFDWAGTTIDYGSRAPLLAFQQTFASFGVDLAEATIRRDMGMDKMAHIHQLLKDERVRTTLAGRLNQTSVDDLAVSIFAAFKRNLLAVLPTRAALKPGVRDLIAYLEANNIAYGTTSGYDADMIAALLPLVAAQGYHPQVNITAADTGIGRPDPAMNRLAMGRLNVHDPARTIIVGDTLNDIRAAQAAGANAVGVIEGANLLALGQDQWAALPTAERQALRLAARRQYAAAGADLIVDNARDLMKLMQSEAAVEVTE